MDKLQGTPDSTKDGLNRCSVTVFFWNENPHPMADRISINPSSVARVLGAIALLLIVASIVVQTTAFLTGHDYQLGFLPLFWVENEENIPSGFSTLLLLFASLLLGVITYLKITQRRAGAPYWFFLSVGFLLMATDEAWSFHENWITPGQEVLHGLGYEKLGIFYFAWIIPGSLLVLILGVIYLRFWLRLPQKTRMHFLIAGMVYLGGAIGGEAIDGSYVEIHGWNWSYTMLVNLEEGLEMAGVILFIWGLLVYFANEYPELQVQFKREPQTLHVGKTAEPSPEHYTPSLSKKT